MAKKRARRPKNLKEQVESDIAGSKSRRFLKFLKHALKALFSSFWAIFLSFIILSLFLTYGLYTSFAKSFDSAKRKNNSTQTVFYDATGKVIYESYGARESDPVKLSEVPKTVINATLAAEDSDFYHHSAIDPRGIVRAMVNNVESSTKSGLGKLTDLFSEENYTQGGSTITQQLVKNVYLTNEKSFTRKMKEIVYAYELEKRYSKDEILEDYLNSVYYGEQALGIKNAAEIYFGKSLDKLTLSEASMLAGLPQAPTKFSPISGDWKESKKRQEYVLSEMVGLGMISLKQAKEAANAELTFSAKNMELTLKYPYFVNFVKEELSSKIGSEAVESGGIKVYTSLDPKKQLVAEKKAEEYLEKNKWRNVTNASVVILNNKKENVSAMVGGTDWDTSKVNVATSNRQPGSSFKPIVYTAGLLNGYTAATILADTYVNFGGNPPYIPHNYTGRYYGNVTVRKALANSLNVSAVEMTKLAGVDKVIETAKKLGISSITGDVNDYGLTVGLGSAEVELFELTRAYSVLARSGQLSGFSGIEKIIDNEGAEIYTKPVPKNTVIDPKVAYIMADILSDNDARRMVFGTYTPLTLKDRKVAAKTGTTDDYADSWTVGFTPQYTVGVWMGNNDRSKMKRVSGVEGAAYIWHDVIDEIHKGLAKESFKKPKDIATEWISPYTGGKASYEGAPNILEYFVPGTEPPVRPDLSYLNQFRSWKKY